jgi:acyl-CoA thioesterase
VTVTYTPKRDEPLFRLDGDLLVPGTLTKGPWYEGTLHGSAMLAAIARTAERHESSVPRQVVRLTVDMMRAAPMTPLRVTATTARAGKSSDLVDVAMYAGDELCVRASALRFRTEELVIEGADVLDDPTPVPQPPVPDAPEWLPYTQPGAEEPAFHHAIDLHASIDDGTVWFRLAVPVVEGEPNSGFVTTAAISDWTYAAPFLLRMATGAEMPEEPPVSAINADTTIHVARPLSGEWLGLRTTARAGSIGAATSSAQLFDEQGGLGFTCQSVLLRRPTVLPTL